MRWLLVVAITIGCSKKRSESESPPAPATVASLDAAKPPGPLDLPALAFDTTTTEEREAARAAYVAARGLHKAGKHAEAIAGYARALALDPGHIYARYDLASAASSAGRRDQALAALAPFRVEDCPLCLSRLSRARADEEWKALWKDPEFVELTAGIELPPFGVKASAKTVVKAIVTGEHSAVDAKVLHPSSAVVVWYPSEERIYGAKDFAAWIAEHNFARPFHGDGDDGDYIDAPGYAEVEGLKCSTMCCRVISSCDGCRGGHDGYVTTLERICFERDSGGAPYLSQIKMDVSD